MLNIEEHTMADHASLCAALVRDLIDRARYGKVIIVASQPDSLLPILRKQWSKELHRAQRQLPSTLDSRTVRQYVDLVTLEKHTRFTVQSPYAELFADVYLIKPDQLAEFGPYGTTVYVTCPVNMTVLKQIADFMPEGGLVVVYKNEKSTARP